MNRPERPQLGPLALELGLLFCRRSPPISGCGPTSRRRTDTCSTASPTCTSWREPCGSACAAGRRAIWGSSLGFLLWHIFGQGPLIGLAALFYGLIFALIRWRAGGIGGLILVHGLMDLAAVQMLPASDVMGLGRPEILHPGMLLLGCALLLALPLGLRLGGPGLQRIMKKEMV